jgi:hypothetical protein
MIKKFVNHLIKNSCQFVKFVVKGFTTKLFFAQQPTWGARTYARTSERTYFKPNPANLKKLTPPKSTKIITF